MSLGGDMSRIRTIKPQFWRDEKIAGLKNKLAGYFFIALWNVADDEGKFQLSPRALSLECPIFRSKEIVGYLSELSGAGLILESACSQWGLIVNWHHQRINKPQVPKVKLSDIQWVKRPSSVNGILPSVNATCMYSIGERKERNGIEWNARAPTGGVLLEKTVKEVTSITPSGDGPIKAPRGFTNESWLAYKNAYKERYGTEPVRNATVSGQLANFVKRVGSELAPKVIEFYVWHPGAFYVKNVHQVRFALADAEKLVTEYKTKKFVSAKKAAESESNADYATLIQDIKENGI